MHRPSFRVLAKTAPRRVVLTDGQNSFLHELEPLGAAWLAGELLRAALQLVNENDRLGVSPKYLSPVILWESQPSSAGGWLPTYLTTVQQVNAGIARCNREGVPWRLTVDMVVDPLAPTTGSGSK